MILRLVNLIKLLFVFHDVDIEVLLEGIETEEEFNVVEPMELDYIQGFLFGRPQSEEEITNKLI